MYGRSGRGPRGVSERGATSIEYAVMTGVVLVAIVATVITILTS